MLDVERLNQAKKEKIDMDVEDLDKFPYSESTKAIL